MHFNKGAASVPRVWLLGFIFALLLSATGAKAQSSTYSCTYATSGSISGDTGGVVTVSTTYVEGPDGGPYPALDCIPRLYSCTSGNSCLVVVGGETSQQVLSLNPLSWLFTSNLVFLPNPTCTPVTDTFGDQAFQGYTFTETVPAKSSCGPPPPPPPPPPPQYTVTLSGLGTVVPSPIGFAQPNTLSINATVTDSNGNVAPGIDVHLALSAVNSSGGHQHGDDTSQLRTGTFPGFANTTYDVTTDATGSATTTFYAPSVSGTVLITATCESVTCTQAGPNSINIMVSGLVSLQSSPDFILVGGDLAVQAHPDNHYLTPQALLKAKELAHLWHTFEPAVPVLAYNDASLVWGGTFDIEWNQGGDWVGPHAEHRAGIVIDVRANGTDTAIPPAYFWLFNYYVRQLQGNTLKEGDHFHVRLLGVGQ
jgi:hypothetical protein